MPSKFMDEKENVDPLGVDISGRCWSEGVDPQILLEKITQFAEKTLSGKMKPGKARNNVLAFLIQNEYIHNLCDHLRLLSEQSKNNKTSLVNNSETEIRLRELEKIHQSYIDGPLENCEDESIPEVDRSVMVGGLTELMIAAQSGNLDRVKELIEVFGADPTVTCNSNMNAYERARDMGQEDVAEYLFSLPS